MEMGEQEKLAKEDPRRSAENSFTPASQGQRIFVAILLILATMGVSYLWLANIGQLNKDLHQETRVAWPGAGEVALAPAPMGFYVDRDHKQLVFTGQIDKATKDELAKLFSVEDKAKRTFQASYLEAIDQLTYKANSAVPDLIISILLLGGISGVVGAVLRSLVDFVGIACFKNQLDWVRWWPWYVMRPFSGFILGVLVVVLIRSGFYSAGEAAVTNTLWWVAVAVMAGFGADDFTQRLRQLSQTLFGSSKPQS